MERLLGKVKRSAAGPPSTLPQMSRLPRQRTPQRTSLPNSGHESRHGRQSGPLRPLRRKDSPHRRPPSLPSNTKGTYLQGESAPPLNRPPKLGRWLCGNRAGSRPGIGHRSDTGQNPYPCPGAAAVLLRPRMLAGKLGGSYASPGPSSHQERLRVGYLRTYRSRKGPVRIKGRSTPSARRSKTAEHTSRRTIKTAGQAAKTAERTARAAPGTMRAAADLTRHTAQAVRATAQTAAVTAKAAARSAVAAAKAVIAAAQALLSALAAGGRVVLALVVVVCLVGILIVSPFGIFFRGRRERPGRRLSICSRGPAQP